VSIPGLPAAASRSCLAYAAQACAPVPGSSATARCQVRRARAWPRPAMSSSARSHPTSSSIEPRNRWKPRRRAPDRARTRCRVSELRFDAIGRIGTRTPFRICPSTVLSARPYMNTRRAGRRSGRSSGSRPGRTRGKDYRRIQGGHRAWAAGSERTPSAGSSPSGSGRAGAWVTGLAAVPISPGAWHPGG
jgi:hypothetical protein